MILFSGTSGDGKDPSCEYTSISQLHRTRGGIVVVGVGPMCSKLVMSSRSQRVYIRESVRAACVYLSTRIHPVGAMSLI